MLAEDIAAAYVDLDIPDFRRAVRHGEVPGPRLLDGKQRWARPELESWILGEPGQRAATGTDPLLLAIAAMEV